MFLEYWFPESWTLYYKDVSSLADDLKRVECSAQFVSLVLLDQDFITQFDAGGTGDALYAACIRLYFYLSVQYRHHVLQGRKHGQRLNQGSSP